MSTRTLAVVTAGLGRPSSPRMLADRLATASTDALDEQGVDTQVEVIELREHAHDLANNMVTGFPGPALAAAIRTVEQADGLIAVTPIFSASYSGLFKSFFDVLDDGALAGKPVLIAATAGTPRHALALEHAVRPLFAFLRAVVVPTAVFAATEDWGAAGVGDHPLTERVGRAAGELTALISGTGRRSATPDPFDSPTPFEQLLAG
ncbi:MAG: FMN reductase [Pseudonocardia sp.]|nr:FMN reductase [Pseudonocardia sp.]